MDHQGTKGQSYKAIKGGESQTGPDPPDEEFYRRKSACFVSIKKDGELRGCISTFEPAEADLGHEIIRNVQSAGFCCRISRAWRAWNISLASPARKLVSTHRLSSPCSVSPFLVSANHGSRLTGPATGDALKQVASVAPPPPDFVEVVVPGDALRGDDDGRQQLRPCGSFVQDFSYVVFICWTGGSPSAWGTWHSRQL